MKKKKELIAKCRQLYGQLRIRTKIMMIFFVVTLSVVVTVSVFLYARAADMVEEEAEDTMLGLLEQTAISAGNVMARVEDICFRMYTNQSLRTIFQQKPEEYSYWQQMEDYYTLMDIYNANMADKYIDGIHLYFKVHGTYVDMQWVCFSMETAMQMPWYEKVVSEKGIHWVGYVDPNKRSNETGYTISCIRAVSHKDEDLGYIEVRLNQNIILEILEKMQENVSGEVFVLTNDGNVLISSEEGGHGEAFVHLDLLHSMLEKGETVKEIEIPSKGKYKLVLSRAEDLLFAAVVPEQMFRTRAVEFVPFVVLIAILELVAAMAMAKVLSTHITGRIAELSDFMQTVSIEGDALARERDNDEITDLIRSYNRMLGMTRKLICEVYETRLAKKETELQLLQAQINPHFLYNTLDSINWMANRRKAYDISKMTRLLANFFRQSLNKGENIVSIRDELSHVRTYLEIIQLRYGEEILVSFEVEENIMNQETIKFILQPIVENAVVHGMMERDVPGGSIRISGSVQDGSIIISVSDDGVGMDAATLKRILEPQSRTIQEGGYGLRNVNERIRLNYGEAYGIRVSSEQGVGTTVEVVLPWREER